MLFAAQKLRNAETHILNNSREEQAQKPFNDFRNLTDTILTHINRIDDEDSDDIITVVIPEFVTALRSQWLHNQSALAIKGRLLYRKNTVVTSVPIVIE